MGLTLQLVYLRYNGLWSVLIPVVGELALILYLTGLKLHFDGAGSSQGAAAAEEGALRYPNAAGSGDEICVSYRDGLEGEESDARKFINLGFGAQGLESLSVNLTGGAGGGGDECAERDEARPREESGEGGLTNVDAGGRALEALSRNPKRGGDIGLGGKNDDDGLEEDIGQRSVSVPDYGVQALEPLPRDLHGGVDGDLVVKCDDGLDTNSGEGFFAVSDASAQALEPLLGEEGQEGRPHQVRRE